MLGTIWDIEKVETLIEKNEEPRQPTTLKIMKFFKKNIL